MEPMTRDELAEWLMLRCDPRDLEFFLDEYVGKTEDEMEEIHAAHHGSMA